MVAFMRIAKIGAAGQQELEATQQARHKRQGGEQDFARGALPIHAGDVHELNEQRIKEQR